MATNKILVNFLQCFRPPSPTLAGTKATLAAPVPCQVPLACGYLCTWNMPEDWQSPPYQSLMRRLFQSDPESDTFSALAQAISELPEVLTAELRFPELAPRSCSKARFHGGVHKHGAQFAQQDLRLLSKARDAVDFEEWVLGAHYSQGVQLQRCAARCQSMQSPRPSSNETGKSRPRLLPSWQDGSVVHNHELDDVQGFCV